MTRACANGRGIRRVAIEARVMAGLKDEMMAPEAAAEAMQAYAEETNRLNRARRASGAADRRELAAIGKKIRTMIAAIEEGGYVRGMSDRLRELEARQDELNERLAAVPAELPDIHPHIAAVYRLKVERLAGALAYPRDRGEAASAIRGLIERIVLTPGEKRGEMHAALHGDLGTILEWAGGGRRKNATDTPYRGMSVSVVAGRRDQSNLPSPASRSGSGPAASSRRSRSRSARPSSFRRVILSRVARVLAVCVIPALPSPSGDRDHAFPARVGRRVGLSVRIGGGDPEVF